MWIHYQNLSWFSSGQDEDLWGIHKTIKWIGNHLNTAPKEDGLITLALIFRNVFIPGFYTWPCEIKQNVYPVNLSITKCGEVNYKMNIKINTQRDVDKEWSKNQQDEISQSYNNIQWKGSSEIKQTWIEMPALLLNTYMDPAKLPPRAQFSQCEIWTVNFILWDHWENLTV